MADKVVWEKHGLLVVEKDTKIIVADCRFRDPTDGFDSWKTNRDRDWEEVSKDVQEIVDLHNEFIRYKTSS